MKIVSTGSKVKVKLNLYSSCLQGTYVLVEKMRKNYIPYICIQIVEVLDYYNFFGLW